MSVADLEWYFPSGTSSEPMAVPGSSPIVVIDHDTDQDSGFTASVESKLLNRLNEKLIKRWKTFFSVY